MISKSPLNKGAFIWISIPLRFHKLQRINIEAMSTAIKKKKKLSDAKRAEIFKKMLADKKTITTHLENRGSPEELRRKGY